MEGALQYDKVYDCLTRISDLYAEMDEYFEEADRPDLRAIIAGADQLTTELLREGVRETEQAKIDELKIEPSLTRAGSVFRTFEGDHGEWTTEPSAVKTQAERRVTA